MNVIFKQFIEDLEPSFRKLIAMEPVKVASLPVDMPKAGIYLFSEGEKHLYVGRTNNMRSRLQNHCRPSGRHGSATFAFLLARKLTGQLEAAYKQGEGSRQFLENDEYFKNVFGCQKARVRNMDVRYVSEPDPTRQALLEMYVAVSLQTPHNNFDNH